MVEMATSVCNLDTQWTGQFATIRTYPVFDFMQNRAWGSSMFHWLESHHEQKYQWIIQFAGLRNIP